LPHTIIVILPLLVIALSVRFGIINKLSSAIVRSLQKRSSATGVVPDELLLQTGEYGIVRLRIKWRDDIPNFTLKDCDLSGKEINILAIERGNDLLPHPGENEALLEGDLLLCYGKLTDLPVSSLRTP